MALAQLLERVVALRGGVGDDRGSGSTPSNEETGEATAACSPSLGVGGAVNATGQRAGRLLLPFEHYVLNTEAHPFLRWHADSGGGS